MALSGTITNIFRTGYQLRIDWTSTQDTINNQDTVTASMYLKSLGSSYTINSTAVKSGAIVIDGSSYAFSGAGLASLSANQDKLLYTASKVITHNPDGKKDFYLSGTFGLNVDLSPYVGTVTLANTQFSLNDIPRMSLLSNFSSITMNGSTQNITVTTTSYSSSYNLDFTLKVGATSIATWNDIVANGGVQEHTFSLTSAQQDAIMNLIPNSNTATMTMYCQTQSGTSDVGTPTSINATATVGSGLIPTMTSVTATEKASLGGITLGANKFLQSISDLILTVNGATGVKGSTIASYSIMIAGQSYTTATVNSTGGLNVSGTVPLTATVTDSRGRVSNVATTNLTFLPYVIPTISSFTVVRCDTLTPFADNAVGTSVKVNYNCSVSSIKPDATELNTLTYQLESKLSTSGTYTTLSSGTLGATVISRIITDVIYATYLVTGAYDFRLTITDKVSGVGVRNVTLALGKVAMSWGVDGIGVGKVITQGVLDVSGDSYFAGNIFKDGVNLFKLIYPVGAIYMSVVSTSPATLFGGTWAVWGSGRVPVGVDVGQTEFDAVEETGGAKTHTLTANQSGVRDHRHEIRGGTNAVASGYDDCFARATSGNDTNFRTGYPKAVTGTQGTQGYGSGSVTADATEAHNNLQPYITCYMWKRTA